MDAPNSPDVDIELPPELQERIDYVDSVASDLDVPDAEAEAEIAKLEQELKAALGDSPRVDKILMTIMGTMEGRLMSANDDEAADEEDEANAYDLTPEGDAAFMGALEGEQEHPLTPEGDAAFYASIGEEPGEDRGADREAGRRGELVAVERTVHRASGGVHKQHFWVSPSKVQPGDRVVKNEPVQARHPYHHQMKARAKVYVHEGKDVPQDLLHKLGVKHVDELKLKPIVPKGPEPPPPAGGAQPPFVKGKWHHQDKARAKQLILKGKEVPPALLAKLGVKHVDELKLKGLPPKAGGAAPPPVDPWYEADLAKNPPLGEGKREDIRAIITVAKPTSMKPVKNEEGKGVNETQVIMLPGGVKAYYKPIAGEAKNMRDDIPNGASHIREAAAASLAEMMGHGMETMVPPTIIRKDLARGLGSVQASHYPKEPIDANGLNIARRVDDVEAFQKMAAFDIVIGNTDRHHKNWMETFAVTPATGPAGPVGYGSTIASRSPLLIDHGLSFPTGVAPSQMRELPSLSLTAREADLHPGVKAMIASIDPAKVATVLHKSGLDSDSIHGALQRLVYLKAHPEIARLTDEKNPFRKVHPDFPNPKVSHDHEDEKLVRELMRGIDPKFKPAPNVLGDAFSNLSVDWDK